MKIALIEPQSPDYHIYSAEPLPRIGLPLLGTILRDKGHDVTVFCQDLAPIDMSRVLEADVVGISTTTSTAPEGYRIAQRVSRKGIPVIIGGVHATFLSDEALNYGDFCIKGEAELSLPMLIENLSNADAWPSIPGLSYVHGDDVVHNPIGPAVEDLDSLPIPDLNLLDSDERMKTTPILTSRGCPYDCEFCAVTTMFGRKYRFRHSDGVIQELHRNTRPHVFFYDDNFTANPARTKELIERIAREGFGFSWSAQVRADISRDREMLELMRRSNCRHVYIGFESVNPRTLEAYNKRQTVEEITESIDRFHSHGIGIHGMFVLGSDEDDPETVRQTAEFALKHKIDTVQFLILTPIPGSRTYDRLDSEGRIFSKRWELFDGLHVVFEPAKMTPFTLQTEIIKAHKRFYSLRECLKKVLQFQFYNAVFRYIGNKIVRRWRRANKPLIKQLKFYRFWESGIESVRRTRKRVVKSKLYRDLERAKNKRWGKTRRGTHTQNGHTN